MSIFSFEFFRGFRPRLPGPAFAAVATLVSMELLLRSGLVHARLRTPAGVVAIPESIRQPLLIGFDPNPLVPSETCGNLMRPNYSGILRGSDFINRVHFNNYGFHDTDFVLERRSPEVRVAVMGMSLTAAEQVPVEGTWLSRVEAGLNLEGRSAPVNIMNFGVNGHFLANTKAVLQSVVLPFHPDLVVLHMAERNLESARMVKGLLYRGYAIRYVDSSDLRMHRQRVDAELTSLQHIPIRYLHLARLFCHLRGRRPIIRNNQMKQLGSDEAAFYDRKPIILAMRDICRQAGVPFTVLMYDRKPNEIPLGWFDRCGIPQAIDKDYIEVNDKKLYWARDMHLNQRGNELYAEALLPVFRRWIDTLVLGGAAPSLRANGEQSRTTKAFCGAPPGGPPS